MTSSTSRINMTAYYQETSTIQLANSDPNCKPRGSLYLQPVLSPGDGTIRVPDYRNFKFDSNYKVSTNGTIIDGHNQWLLQKLPSQTRFISTDPGVNANSNSKIILLSDSICKHVSHVWDLQVLAYPGSNVDDFLLRIKMNRIPEIRNSAAVIIHVGTNNLQVDSELVIMQKVFQLARLIYGKYQKFVLISMILPRLDDVILNQKAKKTNQLIMARVNRAIMHCLFTHRLFLKQGKIISTLYCQLDKIHPNSAGNKLLFKYLTTRVNELRKWLSLPRGEYPPPPKQVIRRRDQRW